MPSIWKMYQLSMKETHNKISKLNISSYSFRKLFQLDLCRVCVRSFFLLILQCLGSCFFGFFENDKSKLKALLSSLQTRILLKQWIRTFALQYSSPIDTEDKDSTLMKDNLYCTLQWYKTVIWTRSLSYLVNYWDFGHRPNFAFNFLYEITRLLVISLNEKYEK